MRTGHALALFRATGPEKYVPRGRHVTFVTNICSCLSQEKNLGKVSLTLKARQGKALDILLLPYKPGVQEPQNSRTISSWDPKVCKLFKCHFRSYNSDSHHKKSRSCGAHRLHAPSARSLQDVHCPPPSSPSMMPLDTRDPAQHGWQPLGSGEA